MKHFYYVMVNGEHVFKTTCKSSFTSFVNHRYKDLLTSGHSPEIWRRVHKFNFVDIDGNIRWYTHHYANISY